MLMFVSILLVLASVEFRSSVDGSICSREPSIKTSMVLPTKKCVSYPGDHQETPVKPPLYHKQPPALPPKPFSRIPNYSTGQLQVRLSLVMTESVLPSMTFPFLCSVYRSYSINYCARYWEVAVLPLTVDKL